MKTTWSVLCVLVPTWVACGGAPPITPATDLRPAAECDSVRTRVNAAGDTLAERPPRRVRGSEPSQVPRDTLGYSVTDWRRGFVVDTSGLVDTASVTMSAKMAPSFGRAMRRAMASWRYEPAMYRGCRVRYLVRERRQRVPLIEPPGDA